MRNLNTLPLERLLNSAFSDVVSTFSKKVAFPVNVQETKDSLEFIALLPGIEKERVDVSIHNGLLTIEIKEYEESQPQPAVLESESEEIVKVEKEEPIWVLKEWAINSGKRVFDIGNEVYNPKDIKAEWKDYTLKIIVGKYTKEEPIKVKIN
jgi:HSP20 family molecular chaperone IbpA